ncbi:MAG: hypothetical protein LC768_08095 [Acidobacteria bacterium]|nr:hypothetical protein [Acidobacteriota bacterium]MCA1638281.1 hypothetical protein [Acidobacteriota bacterium]
MVCKLLFVLEVRNFDYRLGFKRLLRKPRLILSATVSAADKRGRASGSIKKGRRAIGTFLCVSLLLTLFCWTGWQSVRADSSIGNVAAGPAPVAVAVNPVTNKIYVVNQTIM